MIKQFVKSFVNIVTFGLSITYLHILDSSGCPGEKGQTFRKSKMLLEVSLHFWLLWSMVCQSSGADFIFEP